MPAHGHVVILGAGLIAAAGSQAVERGRRSELAYRGPSPVLAFVVVVALQVFLYLIGDAVSELTEWQPQDL